MNGYHVYIKTPDMRTFKAMDLGAGCEVDKLIYASVVPNDKADELLARLTANYPTFQFKLKAI